MRWTFDRIHDAFDDLKDILEDIRNYFNQLAWDKRGSWLLKDITALLNDLLYEPLWDARLKVHDLRERFDDVGDYLVDLDVSDLIDAFFDNLPWTWSYFVDDPWGWVKNEAFKIDSTIYYWLDDPVGEVEVWLIKTLDNAQLLIDDPPKWVMWQLGAWWDGFATLYYNAYGFIMETIYDANPDLWYWLDDPWGELALEIDLATDRIEAWIEDNLLEMGERVIIKDWEKRD